MIREKNYLTIIITKSEDVSKIINYEKQIQSHYNSIFSF